MRFCHSLWTKPLAFKRWDISDQLSKDLWLFSYSAHNVKKHGHELVLHTDDLGARTFGHLPYDEIYTSLNKLSVADVFWAAGKMQAHVLEPLGSVHIDGDVFLTKPAVFEKIQDGDYDLLIQSDDWSDQYEEVRLLLKPYLMGRVFELFDHDGTIFSFNTGVTCFRNGKLKDEFLRVYQESSSYLSRSIKLMSYCRSKTGLALDLLLEQKWLRILCHNRKYKVKKLITDEEVLSVDRIYQEDLGYEHNMCVRKYINLPDTKKQLRAESPELYEKVEKQVAQL